MWQPFLCMPLSQRSSPSLIHSKRPWTALLFLPLRCPSFAQTVYPKFRAQKEITLPLFRLVESAMKRRQLLLTPQVKERALTALILTVLSLFFAHVAIELPDKCWNMKVWFTMYWINLDIRARCIAQQLIPN